MTLRQENLNEFDFTKNFSLASLTQALTNTRIMRQLAALYTFLLSHKVTPQQAVYTFYAQVALIVALLPYNISMGWRALFIALFYQAFKHTNLLNKHQK